MKKVESEFTPSFSGLTPSFSARIRQLCGSDGLDLMAELPSELEPETEEGKALQAVIEQLEKKEPRKEAPEVGHRKNQWSEIEVVRYRRLVREDKELGLRLVEEREYRNPNPAARDMGAVVRHHRRLEAI